MGWRKRVKEIILTGFGSKCCVCGYDKCNEALEFHHFDSEQKDFSISSFKIEDMSNIIKELKKCVCICSNHHREIHNKLIEIPEDVRRYDCRKSKNIIEKCQVIYNEIFEKKNKRRPKKKSYYRNMKRD